MNHSDRFTTVLGTMILAALCLSIACSKVDIDYSHDVVGTGTVMTDYRMGDRQTSEAFGAVRGTGDVIDNYFFSNNNSSEIKVEDRFVLTKTAERAVAMSVKPNFPPWPGGQGSYKLFGKIWAKNIKIESASNSKFITVSAPAQNRKDNVGGKFKFSAASQEGTEAAAATQVSDSDTIDVGATLAVGMVKDNEEFDYQTSWLNSSNVSIRSIVGKPRSVLYEDDGLVSGDSTGLKRLNIFAS
jgi:hypothetical protein